MKFRSDTIKRIHYVRLEKGEDILPSIIEYCQLHKIKSAAIYGIGAVESASLGYYDLTSSSYLENKFNFSAEVISCIGNIAKNEETDEYIAHLHMMIGDSKGQTFGGHVLPNNIISVTGEFVIFETKKELKRKKFPEFNLFLLDL